MQLTKTHIVLFVSTLITTFLAGYLQGGDIYSGLSFSLSLILILGSHEMGHYYYGRKYGILITPPYFIPVPPPFIAGTMGAFIRIKSQITSKKALFDIGVAGPIAGVIAAIPVLIIGIKMSQIVPVDDIGEGEVIHLGDPLIFSFFVNMIHGNLAEGYELFLHPVAFAGWIGLFVTALNLIPSGQLDGGHLVYSLFNKNIHSIISKISIVVIIILGMGTEPIVNLFSSYNLNLNIPEYLLFQGWLGWVIWAFLLVIMGTKHPPTIYEESDIGTRRKIIFIITLLIFIGSFMPVPFTL